MILFLKKTTVRILNWPKREWNRWKRIIIGPRRLREYAKRRPLKLVIGASGLFDAGWVGSDIEYLNLLNPSDWSRFFEKASIDAMLAEHVWEHLTPQEGQQGAKCCFEYLRQGGYLRVAVPDGFHPDQAYIDKVKPGGTGAGAFDHKVLYNHRSFSELFEAVGFRAVPLEYFDAQGEFHFVEWHPDDGKIRRSKRFDARNQNGQLNYTSLILDVYKD